MKQYHSIYVRKGKIFEMTITASSMFEALAQIPEGGEVIQMKKVADEKDDH